MKEMNHPKKNRRLKKEIVYINKEDNNNIDFIKEKNIDIVDISNKYKRKGDERKEIDKYTYTDENGYLNTNKNPFIIAFEKYNNTKFKKEPIPDKYENSQKENNIKNENNLNRQNEDNFSKENKKNNSF